MVDVMKIMVTSFEMFHAHTAALSIPTLQWATADPCLHWRLLNTHREIRASLLWGHCSFLLSHGAHKVLFVLSKSLFPESCESSGGSMVGLMATSPRGLMPYPGLLNSEPLLLQQSTADPYCHRRYSNTVLAQSLWGLWVLICTRFV